MILSSTPYRVSFFGGGTDYPEWFQAHGGCVLGMAIDRYCHVAVKALPEFYGRGVRYRISYSKVENCVNVKEIEHPAVRGALEQLCIGEPLEIAHMGDLPARAGLGASSAFAVGLLNALTRHTHGCPLHQVAREAIYLERNVIRETVGCQDQILTAHGGLNFIEFHPGNDLDWTITPIKISAPRQQELTASLLLAYTGTMRSAHAMATKKMAGMAAHREHFPFLATLAREAKTILENEKAPLALFGGMLNGTWTAKGQLFTGISDPAIDELYERGKALGALGGKLLGAGGGGFMLFFVPPAQRDDFIYNIGVPCVTFGVSERGTVCYEL